jgi:hypothetical protein
MESMRCKFQLYVYGYVVMPEHVHLLVSEPEASGSVADAIHFLKLSCVKRLRALRYKTDLGPFWQKRYFDRNIRGTREFAGLHASQSGEARPGPRAGRLEMEQLSSLCVPGSRRS